MLTREHAIRTCEGGRLVPDRLIQRRHARYLGYGERMLDVYRKGIGRSRRELHQAVQAILAREQDCPPRRSAGFCKLLDDASCFGQDRRGAAAELRRAVFQRAADCHPLVSDADRQFPHDAATTKQRIAAELGMTWDEVEGRLFADIIECQRLETFEGYADGSALLARYNVGQVQVALFDALEMTVWAAQDFKTILRYAKLARLLHTIRRTGEGRYMIRFDGPASVLRRTRRYGVAMAKFLPALIACRGWRLHAVLAERGRRWRHRLELSESDGLKSHLPAPAEFDSSTEERFSQQWGSEPREGWTLQREADILHDAQHTFVPDFAFRHADGRRVLLEIVGYWTVQYLQAKQRTIERFSGQPILLAVSASAGKSVEWPAGVIRFKRTLRVEDVLDRLATFSASNR
jgi:hypothetical protein